MKKIHESRTPVGLCWPCAGMHIRTSFFLFPLTACVVWSATGCSSEDVTPDGAMGAGGQGSGGSAVSGGSTGAGGSSSGGAASGGSSSGGASGSGGAQEAAGGDTSATGGADGSGGGAAVAFALQSPSWDAVDNADCTPENTSVCPLYPQDNTNFGDNVSPEMSWVGVPDGTKSFAILLQDLSNGAAHWAIWDIPADVMGLKPALATTKTLTDPAGAEQAAFNANSPGYFGSGACGNTYEHRLYALGVEKLNPENGATASGVRMALEASTDILAESFVRLQSRDYCN